MDKPALETNGPANIVTMANLFFNRKMTDDVLDLHTAINLLAQMKDQAQMTIKYMQARESDSPKMWHEIIKEGE